MVSLHATFANVGLARQGVADLLEHGAQRRSLTLVAPCDVDAEPDPPHLGLMTSGTRAAMGASQRAGFGLALGVVPDLVSLVIPGYGVVVGDGLLATAVVAAVGAASARAIADAVEGFLLGSDVPPGVAANYRMAIESGSALLSLTLPSGPVDVVEARDILSGGRPQIQSRIHQSPPLQEGVRPFDALSLGPPAMPVGEPRGSQKTNLSWAR